MRKLFLTSAGFKPETKDYFLKMLDKDPKETLAAFIPTAAGPEKDKSYVQWTIDQIEELGMKTKTIDLVDENEQSLLEKLSECNVIIVNGGNTFFLLDWVRKSGFDQVMPKLLNQGKIYVGISAGSYIVCPTIEASTWKHADNNVVNLKDLTGLYLVDFIISAHYEKDKHYQIVKDGASKSKFPVVALTDKQAIVIENDKYKVVGTGERNFFNGFKEK